MALEKSRGKRRIGVIINYTCILAFLTLFYTGKYYEWDTLVVTGVIATVIIGLASFVILHLRTHLWKLVHTKADKLDERQMQIAHESLRYSYGIFTVISLLVLMCIALMGGWHDSMLMLIFASLLYLAHTLPASIIAWTEKEV